MKKPKLFRDTQAQAQSASGLQELELTCQELGLPYEEASQLLRRVVEKAMAQRELANRILDAIDSISDPGFTVEALQQNPSALRELEDGMPVGEVYRKYFLKPGMPRVEKDANLGAGAGQGVELTREDIQRISEYVDRTGKVFSL